MRATRCALAALFVCTVPLAAAEWRVASTSAEGIAFVDSRSVVRSGDKVTFRLDQRWSAPRSDGSTELRESVEADCVSRKWTSTSSSRDPKLKQEIKMTIKTVAAPGTVYDAVVTAACTGEYRSDAVADRARFATAFFAATGDMRRRLDIAAGKPPAETPLPPPEPNRFESPDGRFSLTKPDNWRFVPLEEAKRLRADLKVGDGEMQKRFEMPDAFLESNGVTRLVTLTKRGFTGLTGARPMLQVSVRLLEADMPNPEPKDVVSETLRGLEELFPDLVVDSPVRALELAGHPAADYVATYTVRTKEGRAVTTRNRMVVVVAGKRIFFIAMGSAPSDDQSRQELEPIVSNIVVGG
jgi:hypothetical protein